MASEHSKVADPPPQRLTSGSLGTTHLAIASASYMAPAMSLFFTTALVAGYVGLNVPFVYIIASIGVLATANTIAQFSRKVPSAGSLQTFIAKGLGARMSATWGLVLVIGYICLQAGVITIFGSWTQDLLQTYAHVNVPWQFISIAGTAVFGYLMVRGIKVSAEATVALFVFEFIVLLVLGVVILARGGDHGINLAPFAPDMGKIGSSFFAITYVGYAFIGFEGAASFAEEAKSPHRAIGVATYGGVIIVGLLFIFSTWTTVLGFPSASALAGDAAPYSTVAVKFMGWAHVFVDVAGFTSIAANIMAAANANVRILFNLGREGVAPRYLGRVSSRHGTPQFAIWTFVGLCLAISLVLSLWWSALDVYAIISGFGSILALMVYLVCNASLIRFFARLRELSWWRHVTIPLIGIAVWLLPLWGSLKPGQSFPYNRFPVLVAVVVVVSAAYSVSLLRRRPALAGHIGSLITEATPESHHGPGPAPSRVISAAEVSDLE